MLNVDCWRGVVASQFFFLVFSNVESRVLASGMPLKTKIRTHFYGVVALTFVYNQYISVPSVQYSACDYTCGRLEVQAIELANADAVN